METNKPADPVEEAVEKFEKALTALVRSETPYLIDEAVRLFRRHEEARAGEVERLLERAINAEALAQSDGAYIMERAAHQATREHLDAKDHENAQLRSEVEAGNREAIDTLGSLFFAKENAEPWSSTVGGQSLAGTVKVVVDGVKFLRSSLESKEQDFRVRSAALCAELESKDRRIAELEAEVEKLKEQGK